MSKTKLSFIQQIKDQWNLFKKRNKQKQRQAQAAVYLFDFAKDCPDYIINCYEIREIYKKEISKLQNLKICTACNINTIKHILTNKAIFQEEVQED